MHSITLLSNRPCLTTGSAGLPLLFHLFLLSGLLKKLTFHPQLLFPSINEDLVGLRAIFADCHSIFGLLFSQFMGNSQNQLMQMTCTVSLEDPEYWTREVALPTGTKLHHSMSLVAQTPTCLQG